MNSLISSYAREVKLDGKLTGHMYLNKEDAKLVSDEVVSKAQKNHNVATEDGVIDFDQTWSHFDVNNDGLVEVERMPQFLRYLTNGGLNISLQ